MARNDSCIPRLLQLGISWDDAHNLRRISMTLHRWHELECGDGNDHGSWCVSRGHKRNGAFEYDDNGTPFIEYHAHRENAARYTPIPDRDSGARKRLGKILTRYPTLSAYIQGDPRGASLYILKPGDVPEGENADSYYSRGVAVYK